MIGGLIDEAKTAVRILLGLSTLLLWILSQHHDMRFDSLSIARNCEDLQPPPADKSPFAEIVRRLKKEVPPRKSTVEGFINTLVLSDAVAASTALTYEDLNVILATDSKSLKNGDDNDWGDSLDRMRIQFMKEAAAKIVRIKPDHMTDKDTVFDVWEKTKPRVQVPFIPESVDAHSAVALIALILILVYVYLWSTMQCVVVEYNADPMSRTCYSMLCHQDFTGAVIAYTSIFAPAYLWMTTAMALRLHEDAKSTFGESNGLLFGASTGIMLLLAFSIGRKVWFLRQRSRADGMTAESAASPLFLYRSKNREKPFADIQLLVPNRFAVVAIQTSGWIEFILSWIASGIVAHVLLGITYTVLQKVSVIPIEGLSRQVSLPMVLAYWLALRSASAIELDFRTRQMTTSLLGSGERMWRPMVVSIVTRAKGHREVCVLQISNCTIVSRTVSVLEPKAMIMCELQELKDAIEAEMTVESVEESIRPVDAGAEAADVIESSKPTIQGTATLQSTTDATSESDVGLRAWDTGRRHVLPFVGEVLKNLFLASFCFLWGLIWLTGSLKLIGEIGTEIGNTIGTFSLTGIIDFLWKMIIAIVEVAVVGMFGVYFAITALMQGLIVVVDIAAMVVPLRPVRSFARWLRSTINRKPHNATPSDVVKTP